MSVTFMILGSDGNALGIVEHTEPCMCAQSAECFVEAFENGVRGHEDALARAALEHNADNGCIRCQGTGVETVRDASAEWSMNVSNSNARALIVGLLCQEKIYGRIDLAAARSACVYGAQLLEALDEEFNTSEPQEAITFAQGVLPGGAKLYEGMLTLDGLRDRFLRLHALIENGIAAGGVALTWA